MTLTSDPAADRQVAVFGPDHICHTGGPSIDGARQRDSLPGRRTRAGSRADQQGTGGERHQQQCGSQHDPEQSWHSQTRPAKGDPTTMLARLRADHGPCKLQRVELGRPTCYVAA